jgi:hypothetical protein
MRGWKLHLRHGPIITQIEVTYKRGIRYAALADAEYRERALLAL